MQKIRKGDKVVVLAGKDKGRTGEVLLGHAEGRQGGRARRQHGAAPPEAVPVPGRRDHHQGSADPPVEHRDRRPQGRQADPRRFQGQKDGKKVRVAKRSGEVING